MEHRKVWQLMSLFDADERRRFGNWLAAELDGKEKPTLRLYQLLCEEKEIEAIWAELYPHRALPARPFYDSGYRRLEHQLASRIELYLAIHAFRSDSNLIDLKLIYEFNQRNAIELFQGKFRKIQRKLETALLRDETFHRQRYRLERERLHFLLKHEPRKTPQAHQVVNEAFETWWLHEKLFQAIANANSAQAIGLKMPSFLIEEILRLVEEEPTFNQLPVLSIYQNLYLLLQGRGDPTDLFELFRQYRHLLGAYTALNIFTLLHNYYISQINQESALTTVEQIFTLYEWGYEQDLLLVDGVMPIGYYRNLVTAGLRLGQYEKVWHFIHVLKDFLPPDQREEVFQFNQARYFVKVKEYSQARRILNQKFSNLNFEVSSRLTLLRVRYETGEREELDQELRALKVFVDRQKALPALSKRSIHNEIRLFQKLVRAYRPRDYSALKEKILETQPLGNKDWLLDQISPYTKKTGSS